MSDSNHPLDPEAMEDFFNDFREAHQTSENILIDLEQDPHNKELLNALFRSIHTIKGNLVYVGLKDLTPLIQSVEDLLDAIRGQQLIYDSLLSDLILISMDRTKQMVDAGIHGGDNLYDINTMNTLCQLITSIAESDNEDRAASISRALLLLDPSISLGTAQHAKRETVPKVKPGRGKSGSPVIIPEADGDILRYFHVDQDNDLNFFRSLAKPLEDRSLYWQGRSSRMLRLALAMNAKAGKPIEAEQLAAAVYLHDIGMAFLPLEMLHKTSPLNGEELENLQSHPGIGFQLLSAGRRWEQAALAVLQHHEKVDGTGYPHHLQGKQICDGAKILAIVDTFEACTHERAYQTRLKRPLVRAVLEINRCSESHFDPEWVEIFNDVVRETHQNAA